MRLRKIVNTRVHNLEIGKHEVKLPHIIQISRRIRIAIIEGQFFGQIGNEAFAIFSFGCPQLFFFHNSASDLPKGCRHGYRNLFIGFSPDSIRSFSSS